jgi:hypothetical protein
MAGTYTMAPSAFFGWNRDWFQTQQALIPCSQIGQSGGTSLCHTPYGLGSATQTNGGLIGSSPAGSAANVTAIAAKGGVFATAGSGGLAAANALRGIQFVGTGNIQTAPFNYGTLFNNNSTCFNCSGYNTYGGSSNIGNPPLNAVPFHNLTLFNYTSFKLTDNISMSIQLNYGKNNEQNTSNNGRAGNNTINIDNPYLPVSIRDVMIAGGIPSLTVGVANAGNMVSGDVTIKNFEKAVSINVIKNNRELRRGVFTLDGAVNFLGEDWTWEAYIQHSSLRETQQAPYNTFNQNYSNAIDPVLVTATGPELAGRRCCRNRDRGAQCPHRRRRACPGGRRNRLPFGPDRDRLGCHHQCVRLLQIKPGGLMAGCEPLNILGVGNASQAALNYIAPGRVNRAVMDQALYRLNQTVASATGLRAAALRASRPARSQWRPALNTGMSNSATGATRCNWVRTVFSSPATSRNSPASIMSKKVSWKSTCRFSRTTSSSPWTSAGRAAITSYSTSGMVQTWKLGATSQISDDIKVRASWSNDIRAPGVGELFSAALISTQTNQVYPPPPGVGSAFNVKFGAPGNPEPGSRTVLYGVGRYRADPALDRRPDLVLRLVFDLHPRGYLLLYPGPDLRPVRQQA